MGQKWLFTADADEKSGSIWFENLMIAASQSDWNSANAWVRSTQNEYSFVAGLKL